VRQKPQTLTSLGRAPARTGHASEPRVPAPPPEGPTPNRDRVRRWIHSALFDNVGLKFLSLVLAVTVFLLVNTDRDREIGAEVGVSYTLPDDKVLVSGRIDAVHVTIRGSGRRISRFDVGTIARIDLDLRHAETGEVGITPAMIKLPNGLSIVPGSIHPPSVKVGFERRVDKTVVVTPIASGHPLHGYRVAKLTAEPVVAHGAESVIAALTSIRTTVAVDGRSKNFPADGYLQPPEGITVDDPHVSVQVEIEEVPVLASKMRGVAVEVRGDGVDPAKWSVAPGQVDVTLTGALLSVERAEANLAAVIRVKANETKEREAEVVIEGLPPGIGLVVSPARVKLVPVK
jgi:YbbR domain-containing protein